MPSLFKIGPLVLEKTILNFVNVFLLFHNYLPFEKGGVLHLNKIEVPFTQGCIVLSLVEICPVGLEKKIFKFI